MKPMMQLRLLCGDGMRACGQGDLDNALFQLHMALRLTRNLKRGLLEAKVRNNLGLVLLLRGDPAGALSHLRRARKLAEQLAGTDNGLYRSVAKNLAQASRALDQAAGLVPPGPSCGPQGPRMRPTDQAA